MTCKRILVITLIVVSVLLTSGCKSVQRTEEEDLSELVIIYESWQVEPGKTNYEFFHGGNVKCSK